MWLSLVERLVRDQEAAGSNPVIPTINIKHRGSKGDDPVASFFKHIYPLPILGTL